MEVDLIIAKSSVNPIAAVEFKSATEVNEEELEGLTAFGSEYPKAKLFCFCQTPRAYELPSGIQVLPWREGLAMIKGL